MSAFLFHPRLGEEVFEGAGDGLVALAGVADAGEDLGEVAGAVLAHHFLVEGELLAEAVDAVDVVRGVGMVFLFVHDALHGKTLAEGGLLGGPAQGEGDDGHHALGELEDVGDGAGVVEHRAEVAEAEALALGGDAEVLGEEAGVDDAAEEPEEVAVGLVAAPLAAPEVVAVHVGADGEHHGGRAALAEMLLAELLAQLGFARHHHAVHLHVASVGGAAAALDDAVEDIVVDRLVEVLPHRSVPAEEVFNCVHFNKKVKTKRLTPEGRKYCAGIQYYRHPRVILANIQTI